MVNIEVAAMLRMRLMKNVFSKLINNLVYSTLKFIMNVEKITQLLYIE